jgi:xanthine dehydrogenase accessory factor
MTRSGRIAGSLSGGCVEGDVITRAASVLDDGIPQLVDYGVSHETAFDVGLSCGGTIQTFIERFQPDAAWEAARDALASRTRCLLATALSPAAVSGRRLAVTAGSALVGDIHPAVNAAIASRACAAMNESRIEAFPKAGGDPGISVFLEEIAPSPRLVIVGATHIGAALARMARELDFAVTVVDPRSVFATRERFPSAEIIVGWPETIVADMRLDADTYVVVVSHDERFDVPALELALRARVRYAGMLGSRKTFASRSERLLQVGLGEDAIARIHAPIGLDLGGSSPEEVALSIAAEITRVRYARDGRGGAT